MYIKGLTKCLFSERQRISRRVAVTLAGQKQDQMLAL